MIIALFCFEFPENGLRTVSSSPVSWENRFANSVEKRNIVNNNRFIFLPLYVIYTNLMILFKMSSAFILRQFGCQARLRDQKCMPWRIYLGSCQGKNPVAGHGVFSPATPQVVIRAYISETSTLLRSAFCCWGTEEKYVLTNNWRIM